MNSLAPPYRLISNTLRDSRVIPFLGSGASLGHREPGVIWAKDKTKCLPTAGELAQYFADLIEFPQDKPPDLPPDIERVILNHFAPDLAKVAQYHDLVAGRESLEEELHDIFNCDYPLTSLHTLLADFPATLLIVTTNYDDLIERAFDEKGRPYHLVIHTTDPNLGDHVLFHKHGTAEPQRVIPNKLDIDLKEMTVIYKMHGTVDRSQREHDQYVITENDYIDFLARMMKNNAIPAILAESFQTRHFLFLGYSLSDWNLRVVLNRIEKELRRPKDIKSWAIQYRPKAIEQRFWLERGVTVFDMKIEEFVRQLAMH